jgi:hypothetical protein
MKETQWDEHREGTKGEKGISQPIPTTLHTWQAALRHLYSNKELSVYNNKFMIHGCFLHLKMLKDHHAKTWHETFEMYNVGGRGYDKGRRNAKYMKDFQLYYTEYKTEYKEFMHRRFIFWL